MQGNSKDEANTSEARRNALGTSIFAIVYILFFFAAINGLAAQFLILSFASPSLFSWVTMTFVLQATNAFCNCCFCLCVGTSQACVNFEKCYRAVSGLANLILSAIGIYILNTDQWVLVLVGKINPSELTKSDAETWKSIMKQMQDYGAGDGAKMGIDGITTFMSPAYRVLQLMAYLPFIFIGLVCCIAICYAGYVSQKSKDEEDKKNLLGQRN